MKRSLLTFENVKIPEFKIDSTSSINFNETPWSFDNYKIPKHWAETKGEGVQILVLDTGQPDHEDLKDNNNFYGNFTNETNDQDLNGHQTHCNGIIAGATTGIAPLCTLFSGKVLRKNGSGDIRSIVKALEKCLHSNFDIISMSLGSRTHSPELEDVINKLTNQNKIIVCAAGNSGKSGVSYPAKFKNTIAVAAHDKNNNIAYFSSQGTEVDFAAPGSSIYSTYLNNLYAKLSGTSMACPFIVGVIALMLSKHKKQEARGEYNNCRTPEQVYEHLKRCSIDYGDPGKDQSFGHGLLDLDKLLDGKKSDPDPKPNSEPEPEPNPEPTEPNPKPNPEPWIKRNLAWVVCGTFIIIAFIFYLTSLIQSKTEVYVPYIDEDGNVDWDKKFEEEKKKE